MALCQETIETFQEIILKVPGTFLQLDLVVTVLILYPLLQQSTSECTMGADLWELPLSIDKGLYENVHGCEIHNSEKTNNPNVHRP